MELCGSGKRDNMKSDSKEDRYEMSHQHQRHGRQYEANSHHRPYKNRAHPPEWSQFQSNGISQRQPPEPLGRNLQQEFVHSAIWVDCTDGKEAQSRDWQSHVAEHRQPAAPSKRARALEAAAKSDAMVELARENVILRNQLDVASSEISRLNRVVEQQESRSETNEGSKSQSRYWKEHEHQRFLQALQTIGHKDVKAISQFVGTRNATQVRTHAQKYFMKLARTKKQDGIGGIGNPDQDDSDMGDRMLMDDDDDAGGGEADSPAAGSDTTSQSRASGATGGGTGSGSSSGGGGGGGKHRAGGKQAAAGSGWPPARKPCAVGGGGGGGGGGALSRGRNRGSPSSMGSSSGSAVSSHGTSEGAGSGAASATDNTVGSSSASADYSSSNRRSHSNGSSSESGRCVGEGSSNDGSDPGFLDHGADEDGLKWRGEDDLDAGACGGTFDPAAGVDDGGIPLLDSA